MEKTNFHLMLGVLVVWFCGVFFFVSSDISVVFLQFM